MRDTTTVVDNNFVGGLKTEFTGLNFPPNSATETFNCVFDRTGLVERRLGFELEDGGMLNPTTLGSRVFSTYYWKNVGGAGGSTSVFVAQVGSHLHFYLNSSATVASPLSKHKMSTVIDLNTYIPSGGSSPAGIECQFSDGHGYLFVVHPNLNPFYVVYNPATQTVTANAITIKIRDFEGIAEPGVEDTNRPATLTAIHQYNLSNQGWGKLWTATSVTAYTAAVGSKTIAVAAGLPIEVGDRIRVAPTGDTSFRKTTVHIGATVTSYSGTTLVFNATDVPTALVGGTGPWIYGPDPVSIQTWYDSVKNYPSNADVWWLFKDTSDQFNPLVTYGEVTVNSGPAPKGHHILEAFNQQRTTASVIPGLTDISTTVRPRATAWTAGRIWYAGTDWGKASETIYFSQIIETETQFGKCYQTNDPTAQDQFDLLPSDGGTIRIQGCGSIYKLFAIQNGLLVFAERGVWFVRGNIGIGFIATDYSIVKLGATFTQSGSTFVDVMGYPMWWNDEGIYSISPQQDSLQITSLTNYTIASFYQNIPDISKLYAKGYYNPLSFRVEWLFRSERETTSANRYSYDRVLVFDTVTQAFYPWTISQSSSVPTVNAIVAIGGSGSITSPATTFKYLITSGVNIGFAEESDTDHQDWGSIDYESYFVLGYRVYTKGMLNSQLPYIDFHGVGGIDSKLDFNSRWDYSLSGSTGRWSSTQRIEFGTGDYAYITKRRRTRGSGRAVQLKLSSVDNYPMSIIGWTTEVAVTKVP